MLIAGSVRPAPISPAMPTTSPRADVEVDVVHELPVAVDAGGRRSSSYLEQRLADLRLARRIAVVHVAADHALMIRSSLIASLLTVERLDRAAVAQDGDACRRPS